MAAYLGRGRGLADHVGHPQLQIQRCQPERTVRASHQTLPMAELIKRIPMAFPTKLSEWRATSLIYLRILWVLPTIACLALGAWAVNWPQTLAAISTANLQLVALSTVCLIGTLFSFALRWRQLIAVESPPPRNRVFNLLMIGYLANAILPARPGDIIRAVLLRQIFRISFSYGMAGIIFNRFF